LAIFISSSVINVYVDEAGDLGFGDKASRYFIVAYAIIEQPGRISVNTQRLLKTLNNNRRHPIDEFKFSNDNEYIRLKFLNLIRKSNFDGGQVVIKKAAVKEGLRDKKLILYNFVVADSIATAIVNTYDNFVQVNLHLDRSMSKESRVQFDDYFERKMNWKLSEFKKKHDVCNKISHDYSHHESCIQVVDYIAGSLFQLFERENPRYYDVIKDKIIHKNEWG
jgi:Protein of unknown function (DUF3800)